MRDFENDRKKNLDLVICTPAGGKLGPSRINLSSLAADYKIPLSDIELATLEALPVLQRTDVGSVLVALEAKACMTAHQRALPRLYDELNSSHLTVHGSTDQAVAVGFTMVNIAERYLSTDLNKVPGEQRIWSKHDQPRDAQLAIDKIRQLKRRSRPGDVGYDALAIAVIDCANDGSPVTLIEGPPAPPDRDIYNYVSMIDRVSHIYSTRFRDI